MHWSFMRWMGTYMCSTAMRRQRSTKYGWALPFLSKIKLKISQSIQKCCWNETSCQKRQRPETPLTLRIRLMSQCTNFLQLFQFL